MHLDLIQRHPYYMYYRDAIIGLGIVCNTYLDIHKYGKAYIWTERLAELVRGYEKVPDGRPDYADADKFRDGAEQNDDLTILAFQVTASSKTT